MKRLRFNGVPYNWTLREFNYLFPCFQMHRRFTTGSEGVLVRHPDSHFEGKESVLAYIESEDELISTMAHALLSNELRNTTFHELIKCEVDDFAIQHLVRDTRAVNGLRRKGINSVNQLRLLTPRDLMDLRNFGVTSFYKVVADLIALKIVGTPDDIRFLKEESDFIESVEIEITSPFDLNPAFSRRLELSIEALLTLDPNLNISNLLDVTARSEDEISNLVEQRLLLPDDAEDPVLAIREIVSNFTEQQMTVLRLRIVNRKPLTLEAVGNELDLTRERVRQIENSVKDTLTDLFGQDYARLRIVLYYFENLVGPFALENNLLEAHSWLGTTIWEEQSQILELSQSRSLRVIDILCGVSEDIEHVDQYLVHTSLLDIAKQVVVEFKSHDMKVTSVSELLLKLNFKLDSNSELDELLQILDLQLLNGIVIPVDATFSKKIEALLRSQEAPFDIRTIRSLLGGSEDIKSIASHLNKISCIKRDENGLWGYFDLKIEADDLPDTGKSQIAPESKEYSPPSLPDVIYIKPY